MTINSPQEEYSLARERIQRNLAARLRAAMATLVCNRENADLVLVAADGKKLPAHECILRARAPGFYQRHVEATVSAMGRQRSEPGQLREVAIGEIDSAGLEFFIHSVYTEDEIPHFPQPGSSSPDDYRRDSTSRSSQRSFHMEDSTSDLDDFRSEAEDSSQTEREGGGGIEKEKQSEDGSHEDTVTPEAAGDTQQLPQHLHTPIAQRLSHPLPTMTSFRELASSGSPMNSSFHSLAGRSEIGPDIPEEEEEVYTDYDGHAMAKSDNAVISKPSRLDRMESGTPDLTEGRRSASAKTMFSTWIGLGDGDESGGVPEGIRGRALMAKRLSVASLTSLTSIDMTSSTEVSVPGSAKQPSCRLAADLLRMFMEGIDTDVVIRAQNGDLFAHRCILSALSPFFRQQLKKSPKIEMKGYSKSTVHYLLTFLYGGVTSIPDEIDVWEVVSLSTHLNLKDLTEVVMLHLKMTRCHFFHRPCATCVSAVFDMLPQLNAIRCLRPLYDEVMAWQARHFCRIWKGRVFLHLVKQWQKECEEALVAAIDDETVIDIILGCERLQTTLPRVKSEASAVVAGHVNDILDMALQFLTHSFHLVLSSRSFLTQGKGLALNVSLLEEVLPPLVHSLSADNAIKSWLTLQQLKDFVVSRDSSSQDISPRFAQLVNRLSELVDKHILHFAASVVRAEAWNLFSPQQQHRIQETGIFVEMRQPKGPPPRLSSFYRTYKRSASAGVQCSSSSVSSPFGRDRNRSIERGRPHSTLLSENLASTEEKEPEKEAEDREEIEKAKEEVVPLEAQPTPPPPERKIAKKPPDAAAASPKRQPPSSSSPNTSTTSSARREELKKSPAKKKAIETDDGRLERQTTHTVIATSDAVKEAAALLLPASPRKSTTPEKPKSVVKPMPQETPLSAGQKAALPRVAGTKTASSSPGRSAIPRSRATGAAAAAANTVKAAASEAAAERRRPRTEAAAPAKAPRSPKNARKTDLRRHN